MWLRKSCIIPLILVSFLTASCGENVFKATADETTDAALLIDARRALGQKNWPVAIQKIEAMSTAKQAEKEIIFMKASAYGGQCGLAFVEFSSAFGSADFATSSFFVFVLNHFVDSTDAARTACGQAEATYDLITSNLNTADYLNRAYLAMAKVGVALNEYNSAAGQGNAHSVGTLNPCTDVELSDDHIDEIITGISRTILNAGSAGLGGAPTCPGGVDCDLYDAASINGTHRTAFRTMLNSALPVGLQGTGGC